MASVRKHTYTVVDPTTGERVTRQTRKWYVEYTDATGKRQRVPGYVDKRATDQLAANLEREAAQISAGVLPANVRDVQSSLAHHLQEYLTFLREKNDTAAHVASTGRQIEVLTKGCHVFADLTSAKVSAALARLRADGLSPTTSNNFLGAVKAFSRWLANKLELRDPLAGLSRLNAAADLRRKRRALSHQDFVLLVETAQASPRDRCRLSGPERAFLYLVAAYTGLRASELASLTPESFRFDAEPPTVTLQAAYSKHRREDVLPLPPDLAARLKAWIADLPAGEKLWRGHWAKNTHGTRMLKVDLAAAGIPYRDAEGRAFDFHCLRMTYITSLIRSGASLVTAQKLARHSTPALTANVYTKLSMKDLSDAVNRLPGLPPAG